MSVRVNSLKRCKRAPVFPGNLSTQPVIFPCKSFHIMFGKSRNNVWASHWGGLLAVWKHYSTSFSSMFPTRFHSNKWEQTQGWGPRLHTTVCKRELKSVEFSQVPHEDPIRLKGFPQPAAEFSSADTIIGKRSPWVHQSESFQWKCDGTFPNVWNGEWKCWQ